MCPSLFDCLENGETYIEGSDTKFGNCEFELLILAIMTLIIRLMRRREAGILKQEVVVHILTR